MTVYPRRALVLDDDPRILSAMVVLLGQLGFDCVQASDAASALEAIAVHRPALVIADHDLGDRLTGLDVLREAQREIPEARLVLFTGRALRDLPPLEGLAEHLEKPVTAEYLARFLATSREAHLGAEDEVPQ